MKNNTANPLEKTDEKGPFNTWRESITRAAYPRPVSHVLHSLVDVMESRGYSQAETARKIKHGAHKKAISPPTLNQLLRGTYGADPGAIINSIQTFINIETGRAIFRDGGFVKTRLFDKMIELADVANTTQRITVMHGGNFCGKSINAEALHINYNRANTVFVTCPYGDSYGGFVKRLAAVLGLSVKGTVSNYREAILEAIDERHLLIVDEFHQPPLHYTWSQALRVMAFIREINDLCRCGVLLVGHSEGYNAVKHGEGFEALADRIILGYNIAGNKTDLRPGFGTNGDRDLEAICTTYKLPAPKGEELDFCRDLIKTNSVGRLFDMLKISAGRAKARDEVLQWSDILATNRAILKLN